MADKRACRRSGVAGMPVRVGAAVTCPQCRLITQVIRFALSMSVFAIEHQLTKFDRSMIFVLPRLQDSKAICVANEDLSEDPGHQQSIEFLRVGIMSRTRKRYEGHPMKVN